MCKTEKAFSLNKLGEGDSRKRLFESCITKILAAKEIIFLCQEQNAQVNLAQILICTWLLEHVLVKLLSLPYPAARSNDDTHFIYPKYSALTHSPWMEGGHGEAKNYIPTDSQHLQSSARCLSVGSPPL